MHEFALLKTITLSFLFIRNASGYFMRDVSLLIRRYALHICVQCVFALAVAKAGPEGGCCELSKGESV